MEVFLLEEGDRKACRVKLTESIILIAQGTEWRQYQSESMIHYLLSTALSEKPHHRTPPMHRRYHPSETQSKRHHSIFVATLSHDTLLRISPLLHRHLNTLMLRWSHRAREIIEPRMLQRIMGTDSQLGPQLQHSLQQINTARIDLREDLPQVLCSIHLEVLLVFGELGDPWPGAFRWSAHNAEDTDELVFVGGAGEERASGVHFCHDAAGGPDIDAGVVGAGAEEDVRGAVPEGYDFVGECVNGDSEGSGKTEICELQLAFEIDEEILRLQIAVQDSVGMTEVNA